MEDQGDLDILACLVDSDSEILIGEDHEEVFTPLEQSEIKTSCSPLQSEQQHGGQDNVKSTLSVDEMAARMANMEKYIQQLEHRVACKEAPPSPVNINSVHQFAENSDVLNNKSAQPAKENTQSSKGSHGVFLKNSERIAYTIKCSKEPEKAICNSIKRKAGEYLEATRKKSSEEVIPKRCLGSKKENLLGKSIGPTKKPREGQLSGNWQPPDDDKEVTKEKFSGLRIVKPVISSVVMEKRMEGRRFVHVSQIPKKIKGKDIEGDWVTIGVIVHKLPPKKSSNGKTYGIWKLSDLGPSTTNEVVALFLFGEVYKEHWKTTEGSVVALLNSTILPAKEKNSSELALTLDNPKKVMLMGISRDLGRCKGTRKSDERPCHNFINKQHGEFCEYHIQAAYKKMRSQRMECQTGYGPSEKAPLMKKFHKDLNSSTFMYQGRTVTASSHETSNKQNNVTLKNLDKGNKSFSKAQTSQKQEKKSSDRAPPSDFFLELLSLPSVGTRNLIRHLNQDEELKKPEEERKPSKSASELLKAHEKSQKGGNSSATNTIEKPFQNASSSGPILGRGVAPGNDVFFDVSTSLVKRKTNDVDKAKLKALSIIKQKGPIEKDDPNAVRKKHSPKAQGEIERRVIDDSGKENSDENCTQDSRKKRRRILGPEFGSIDLNSKEGKALMAAKSAHVGAVKAVEAEKEEQYFNELEKKEQLEDKMKTIMEIKVKVVICKQCNYVAESASELCYKENHTLKHSKTLKKFFACKECKQRTITYGAPIPKHPCKNCGVTNYQRTSMFKEKEGPKIGGETLLVRGEELPKFLNSLK